MKRSAVPALVLLAFVSSSYSQESDLREIQVPGSPTRAWVWNADVEGSSTPHYALSLDGDRVEVPVATSYELRLRFDEFDPVAAIDSRAVEPSLHASSSTRLWIVQYWTQGLEAYRDVLRESGATIHLFLANHANVVEMDPALAAAIERFDFVRWVGPFHAAYKLEDGLLQRLEAGVVDGHPLRVNILTLRRGPAGRAEVVRSIEQMGGIVEEANSPTFLMSATLTMDQIERLAHHDGVQWIDRWSPPEEDMDIARSFHGANYVESVGNYRGQGVRVEVLDGGCDEIHPDIQNFLVHGTNTPSSHGTCCSGIVLGSGANNAAATGAMPDAFLVIGDYNGLSGSRYNHTSELQDAQGPYRTVLQTNSWGNTRTTSYTSISQDLDLILFDFPRISICQSQSNAGNQDSRPQAWAKNIISVGGIRHANTTTKADDSWNFGASIGPAADGRIKPDLASFYDSILATDRVGSAGYTSTNYYTGFGGTSGATPIVAGHLGLAYQMWNDGIFGNPAPGASVFENRPQNTTMKALLINTATQWSFSGTNADLTRTHQGWGHPDLQSMYDRRNNMLVVDETDVLTNLASTSHPVTVNAGAAALRATLVFRDPPGTTSSSLHRINNLDLKVTSPGGTVYWGNNGLLAGMWSASGGSANTVDTVENVFVQSPSAGTWTVEVIAAEVNQDSHVETGAVDVDYALVISGIDTGPTIPPTAEFSGAPLSGDAPVAVSFTDQSTGTVNSWSWTFGDGGSSTDSDPTHVYTTPGTYDVSLAVTGPAGSDSLTKTAYVTVTLAPPAAPSGLSATAMGTNRIDLVWSDNANNEDGFRIDRSPDAPGSWSLLTTLGANATSYSDLGLTESRTYFYRARAFNAAGESANSNEASATTAAAGTVDHHATGDVPVSGTVGGTFAVTQASDDVYQTFLETESGGRKRDRHSFFEHRWTFDVAGGSSQTLFVEAHHSTSSDGDDLVFAWSQDGTNFSDVLVVTKTSDDDTAQSVALPSSLSGVVTIRVRDSDRTQGNRALDTGFVDEIFIRTTDVGGSFPPGAPSGLLAMATSSSTISLSWTDGSSNEDSFRVERSPDNAAWSEIASLAANTTSFLDGGLSANSTYYYRVRAGNTAGFSAYSNVASDTTPSPGTTEVVASGESAQSGTVTGTYLDTQSSDDVAQSIRERESGGRPENRTSFLEHHWTFQVPSGSSTTFFVEAWHDPSSDGDDFAFEYSVGGSAFSPLLVVTKTSDDDTYQSFLLPTGTSGTVTVRVIDTDRGTGNRSRDTVYVDHMFLRVQ